jgi:glycolate oxidase FAD binding subunit
VSELASTMRALAAVVGEEHLLTSTEAVSNYAVDGRQPAAVALPGSEEQTAGLLRVASESDLSVLLWGAGHHMYRGGVPEPVGLVVVLNRLNEIAEYDAENLTVTAGAGVSLDQLQRTVGERGQMLPLDPPGPGSATLGGIAALNLAGPLRMRWGAPRDLVIGLRVALADGSAVKMGGKTVKNVAGYDLSKLFVGSQGTLGAICELTLRLAPIPESRALMVAAVDPPQAASLAHQLLASRLDIGSLDIVNHEAARRDLPSLPVTLRAGAQVICVGLAGQGEAVARQERDIRALSSDGWARIDVPDAGDVGRALSDIAMPRPTAPLIARVALPKARASDALGLVSSFGGWWAAAHAGDGLVHAGPAADCDLAEAVQMLVTLREWAAANDGWLALESGPADVKRTFPVWGDGLPNLDLMRRLKDVYDPGRTLGCGRFLPGL